MLACASSAALGLPGSPPQGAALLPRNATTDPSQIERKNPWGQVITEPCTFVLSLHVRKCGGASVRTLFDRMEDWQLMPEGVIYNGNPVGQHWMEASGNQDLTSFAGFVGRFRKAVEPQGCKVVSTALFRNAVDQVTSEWFSFFQNIDKSFVTPPLDPAWASNVSSYVLAHPENELRWLTQDAASAHQIWQVGNKRIPLDPEAATGSDPERGTYDPAYPGPGSGLSADCDEAVKMAKEAFEQVDLVGTMDTPAEFASFWIALGAAAGVKVDLPIDPSSLIVNSHGGDRPDHTRSTEDGLYKLSAAEHERARSLNACSQQVTELARQTQADYMKKLSLGPTAVSPAKAVEQLLADPKWSAATSSLGREHEDLARWAKVKEAAVKARAAAKKIK